MTAENPDPRHFEATKTRTVITAPKAREFLEGLFRK